MITYFILGVKDQSFQIVVPVSSKRFSEKLFGIHSIFQRHDVDVKCLRFCLDILTLNGFFARLNNVLLKSFLATLNQMNHFLKNYLHTGQTFLNALGNQILAAAAKWILNNENKFGTWIVGTFSFGDDSIKDSICQRLTMFPGEMDGVLLVNLKYLLAVVFQVNVSTLIDVEQVTRTWWSRSHHVRLLQLVNILRVQSDGPISRKEILWSVWKVTQT